MGLRSHWNGYLKLSLVSCPVALYPALAAAERLSFRQVNRHTGHRLRHQLVDEVTGEKVRKQDRGKGFEVAPDRMVLVEDAELDRAEEIAREKPFRSELEWGPPVREGSLQHPTMRASQQRAVHPPLTIVAPAPPAEPPPPPIVNNRTIAMDRFVSLDEVDLRYLDTPYYITPRDEVGVDAFAVIRDALARKAVAGMGRIVLARRERPFLVESMGKGMRGFTLRYAHEVRDSEPYVASIPQVDLPDDMVEMAELLLEAKSGKFDTRFLEDRYRTTVLEMLREKQTIGPRTLAATPSRQNVIDLMSALKGSLEKDLPSQRQGSPKRRAAAAAVKASPRKRQRPRSG